MSCSTRTPSGEPRRQPARRPRSAPDGLGTRLLSRAAHAAVGQATSAAIHLLVLRQNAAAQRFYLGLRCDVRGDDCDVGARRGPGPASTRPPKPAHGVAGRRRAGPRPRPLTESSRGGSWAPRRALAAAVRPSAAADRGVRAAAFRGRGRVPAASSTADRKARSRAASGTPRALPRPSTGGRELARQAPGTPPRLRPRRPRACAAVSRTAAVGLAAIGFSRDRTEHWGMRTVDVGG